MTVPRWILVLPGAAIAGYLAWLSVVLLNRISMAMYVDPNSFVARAFIETVSHIAMGTAAVWVGVRIAPSEKQKVALALAVLVALAAGVLLVPAFRIGAWWSLYTAACLVFGAASAAWSIFQDEGDDLNF